MTKKGAEKFRRLHDLEVVPHAGDTPGIQELDDAPPLLGDTRRAFSEENDPGMMHPGSEPLRMDSEKSRRL